MVNGMKVFFNDVKSYVRCFSIFEERKDVNIFY